jgi:hypothetical protein
VKSFEELSLSEIMAMGTKGTTKPGGIGVSKTKACQEKLQRMKMLPKTMDAKVFKPFTKLMALKYIKNFHDGIKNKSFGLVKLDDGTVKRKVKLGFPNPKAPLYGAGDEKKDRSYMNMMRLHELKNGYSVRPSTKKHWKAKMKLSDLFIVHEYGTIIKRGDTLIRIPARPVSLKAFKKTLKEKRDLDMDKTVKRIISKNINQAAKVHKGIEQERLEKGLAQFDRVE